MSRELKQKRSGFEATYAALQDEAAQLEEAQREMRELIRQRVEQLVWLIRREEEELLGLVEARQEQGRRELARELQRMAGVLGRMEAGERLVEKMCLYATEQEVMDMQPFIKESLEELQRLQPPAAGDRAQPRNFAECRARLQALVERVTGHPGEEALGQVGWGGGTESRVEGYNPWLDHILHGFQVSFHVVTSWTCASSLCSCSGHTPASPKDGMQLLHPSLPKQRLSLAFGECGGPPNAIVLGGNMVNRLGWSRAVA